MTKSPGSPTNWEKDYWGGILCPQPLQQGYKGHLATTKNILCQSSILNGILKHRDEHRMDEKSRDMFLETWSLAGHHMGPVNCGSMGDYSSTGYAYFLRDRHYD
jgi:hypothetical protein